MIEQLLRRDFVRDQLDQLREELRGQVSRLKGASERPPDHLEVEDFQEALANLNATARREARRSSGQPGFDEEASSRRRRGSASLDERSFFSRDPIMSIVQSALEEYFDREGVVRRKAESGGRGRRRGGDVAVVTDLTLTGPSRGRGLGRGSKGRRILEKFSITDAGWINSKIAEGIRLFRKKAPFNPRPADPVRMGARTRLVLVGDWGSGIPRARKVAAEMRTVLDEGIARGLDQHVIHLGDVYYSGWEREYVERFLAPWPVRDAEADRIGSWSLNGNHDMYCGGHNYYGVMLADRRFSRQKRSSFFSLSNDVWDVLGLDTAWEDADLAGPQADWVSSRARPDRKLMLLSHHQPFSIFERCGKAIRTRLGPALTTGRVRAWFWGHEHRCATYDAHAGVAHGRCIGHGGVPVYQLHDESTPLKKPARYEFRDYVRSGLIERWALFGFTVVDFDGDRAHVRYIDENGTTHYEEDID